MQGGSVGARTQGAGEGVADAGARVEQRVRGGAEWALEHGCAGMTPQGRSKRRRAPAQEPAARSGASARDVGTRWRRP
jgi:hypothetical protein